MTREEFVLAAMAPAQGQRYTPVQVQKLLFLLEQNIPEVVDDEHFDFQPYSYGPFDKTVYHVLEALGQQGDVSIGTENTYKEYSLTVQGQQKGQQLLDQLEPGIRSYIVEVSNFVRRVSFSQLVRAIYKDFPEMRENSIFQG